MCVWGVGCGICRVSGGVCVCGGGGGVGCGLTVIGREKI